ncbi:outer membrane protein assembly factor BamC [Vibrio caribbeanicus]|uniref:outer membrane protein assembly factor BamC n=1 Tax=Vibrio caribbeanicus TaxID=701175 RepID=UPI0022853161|nr:outer membrane protein assembly factor BamC [Vibrio caribbeanicus]MCY9846225.1 outer membrane protein assembly factor BamC [Vibrio caribbeanicus]
MKLSHQLVVSTLAVLVLSACSSSPAQRRQAKNDFDYLNTTPLKDLQLLKDAEPEFYKTYQIPSGQYTGGQGKEVDIRPPQQVLELIPGARVERKNGDITLWVLKEDELKKIWRTTQDLFVKRGVSMRENTESRIETDWLSWQTEDEDSAVAARFVLEKVSSLRNLGIKISLVDWREGAQSLSVTASNKERYTTLLTNIIESRYDDERRQEMARKAEQLVKHIPISLGVDRSGLPVIIARISYDLLWDKLPTLLPAMGFEIEERNQSQGTVKAKYAAPDDEFWTRIGVKPINLKSGSYTFLFGDLGNRTSINVTDSKGKPIEEKLLKDMVPVLAAIADDKHK